MRFEGTLSKWNDDRGFGFITPTQGGQEIFVHISAFPKDGRRPTVGEKLSFEIETGPRGGMRARKLLCPFRPTAVHGPTVAMRPTVARGPSSRGLSSRGRKESSGFFGRAVLAVILLGLGFYAYGEYSRRAPITEALARPETPTLSPIYRCDGRAHCSQMSSCAEATFFLRNCPGVKMDGDGDGVPCERQWCAGSF